MIIRGLISYEVTDNSKQDLPAGFYYTGTIKNTGGNNVTVRLWSSEFDGGKADIFFDTTGNLYIEQFALAYIQVLSGNNSVRLYLAKLEREPDEQIRAKLKYTA